MADQSTSQPRKKLYIETVGCQMNVLDSELVVARLREQGYELTTRSTRPIRSSTTRARSGSTPRTRFTAHWGGSSTSSERRPEVSIGVLGCMAQKDQEQILKRAPHVDVVVGPGQLARVPQLLARAREVGSPQLAVSLDRDAGSRATITASFESYDADREPAMRPSPFQAFVRVMMGCDKFCTYCIVPSVRGPEQSRPPAAILGEARLLVDQGVKEITLLGQTVNSYKYREPDGRITRLSDLLSRIQRRCPASSGSSSSRASPTT